MVLFDKEIVSDPLDDLDKVHAPNKAREGPVHTLLSRLMHEDQGGSYHNTDPTRGHLSSSNGCQRRSYLNYVHKLDDDLEVPRNDNKTNWTFSHGNVIHELIQDMLVDHLGAEHVTKEETVTFDINDEYYIYGHADLVIRGLDSVEQLNDALPAGINFDGGEMKGFPDPFIIDIKTKSEFKYYDYNNNGHARTVPKESNIMQLNGYMGILGEKIGCLLYFSKRNDHIEEYWVEYDDELFEKAKDNITTVLNSVNTGTPAPRNPDGEYRCQKFCKWYKQGKCPGMEGVDPHENWDGDEDAFVYDHPDWDEESD